MATAINKKFQITLDRDPPVYYAGELVTGTLAITPSQNEKCRSLQVALHGKSHVHWHTGSGDDRKDYDGEKKFLISKRTLWGNFYRTTLLNEAGEVAEFGKAVGDGTMYIPCRSNEGESGGGDMKLVVRVCDYDFGKKDDNLGEVVIAAKDLVSANDAVTFNLTRDGKPEQGTITLAGRFVPTSAFLPDPLHGGSPGTAPVASSELLILTVLKAENLRKGDWFGKNDVYVQAWRAPDDVMKTSEMKYDLSEQTPSPKKKIPGPSKDTVLPNGRTEFKFAFHTRADSPGSASFQVRDYAYIAYYVYAKIDKKWKRDPSIKLPITIIPSRPVPLPQLLTPFEDKTDALPLYSINCCCLKFGESGNATIKVKLGRRAYAPGETIELFSELTNDSTLPVDLRVRLKQQILMTTTNRAMTHTNHKRITFSLYERHCEAQSSLTIGDNRDDKKLTVPPVPPSFFGTTGLVAGNRPNEPLVFTYYLQVQAKAGSGSKVDLEIPILISALPPKAEAVLAALNESPVDIHSPFDIKNFAVTDHSPCSTVRPHTGEEDGGNIVPSDSGASNLWNMEEDMGSDTNKYEYTPSVMVFPTFPSNNSGGGALNVGYEEEDTNIDLSESPHSNAAAYDALLSSISTESNPRLAVDGWIKQFPDSASSLSSEQFAGALKKVIFSLEQPIVARELMSGLAPDLLTTDYILKAMDACPFNKTDIAMTMAPGASDPENKELVLQQVYSYERQKISELFKA